MSSQLPASYRAAVINKAGGGYSIETRQFRAVKPDEVLIKVQASAMCHSDLFTVLGYWPNVTYPRVPGHEVIGTIVELGAEVPSSREFKVGQRVGCGWHGRTCFGCTPCMEGQFVLCESHTVTGINVDGGHAEYAYFQWATLAKVPDTLSSVDAAPILCAGVTVFNGLRKLQVVAPALVAVLGIGGLGSLAITYAAKLGYTVVAVSSSSSKEKLARELGATYYIDSSKSDVAEALQKLGGASVIIATAFNAEAQSKAFGGLGRNGTLLVLGVDQKPIEIGSVTAVGKQAGLRGHSSGSPMDSEQSLTFAGHHGIKSLTEVYKLEDAQAAYDRMMSGKALFRVVLKLE